MNKKEINEYITSVKWQFAKTMPDNPHEYTMTEWNPDKKELFDEFVLFIRKNGYEGYYFQKKFMYYDFDGYKYWTMGNPLEETTLINRAKL
jgi:hypothetical protein